MAKKKKEKVEAEVTTLSSVEESLTKEFGDDVFVTGNYLTDSKRVVVPVSPILDAMLGGGVPFGSFVIPTGPPKVGKTSMSLDMAASALKIPSEFANKRHLYFFNIEGRLNKRDLLGIRQMVPHIKDDLTVIQSRPGKILNAEDYLNIGERLINEKPGCIFIFDSFSQLCSKAGRENEWDGKAYRDNVPNYLSLWCKRISNVIPINKSIVVGITHQIANTGFGFSAWAEASGNKIQYQVDVKLKAEYCKPWVDTDKVTKIGQEVYWECLCSPLWNGSTTTKCVSKLRYGYGIDKPAELINMCVDLGLITKGGAWYTFGENKFQGLDKARDYLVENQEVYEDLYSQYREMMAFEC